MDLNQIFRIDRVWTFDQFLYLGHYCRDVGQLFAICLYMLIPFDLMRPNFDHICDVN